MVKMRLIFLVDSINVVKCSWDYIFLSLRCDWENKTSRDRPKSAPYLRLKKSKRTSICQSIGELGTLLWKKNFGKKSHNVEENGKGGPFGGLSTSILSQNIKKLKGDPLGKFFSGKKVSQCRKNWKGGPFGLAWYCMLRGKRAKTFLVQFARPNGAIWCNNIS